MARDLSRGTSTPTTHGIIYSARARRVEGVIRYRVVDEYEADECGGLHFDPEPPELDRPLTFSERTDLLWSIHGDNWGQIWESAWEEQREGPIEDYENDFYEIWCIATKQHRP